MNIEERLARLKESNEFQNVFKDAGFNETDVRSMLKTNSKQEFLPFDNEANVNYDEQPTRIQCIEMINNLKQLALKVGFYVHVKHHTPIGITFEALNKVPTFHLYI